MEPADLIASLRETDSGFQTGERTKIMVHVFCQVAIELANGHPQIGAARELNFPGKHADNGVALIV
jgi:hypothetical protein